MKLLERILIATDFSPGSDDAVAAGLAVAKQFKSEVTLLHVVPGGIDRSSLRFTMISEKMQGRLEQIATRMRDEGIETVDTVVESGVPFDRIDRLSANRNVNVIFIGACKEAERDRAHVGTTAARLRSHTTRPVWMVKPGTPPRLTHIL